MKHTVYGFLDPLEDLGAGWCCSVSAYLRHVHTEEYKLMRPLEPTQHLDDLQTGVLYFGGSQYCENPVPS